MRRLLHASSRQCYRAIYTPATLNLYNNTFRNQIAGYPLRSFSSGGSLGDDGSDPDFQATSKVKASVNDAEELHQFLDNAVKSRSILLFMKGSPSAPLCGFSAKVVEILKNQDVDFDSANVLASQEIREGIKKYSDWPTIPQLYVNSEFIGGCDIVTEMDASGDLEELLKPIKIVQDQKIMERTEKS